MILGRHAHKGGGHGQQALTAAVGWDALGAAGGDRPRLRRRGADGGGARGAPVAAGLRTDRGRAGLLSLGARLRPDLRARRLRPPGRKPAVGAATNRRRGAARRRRSVVAAGRASRRRRTRPRAAPRPSQLPRDARSSSSTAPPTWSSMAEVSGLTAGSSRTSPGSSRTSTDASWSRRGSISPRRGITALIHPETHFTDEKAGVLRAATYRRLRRHWQFINELVLFEIDHRNDLRRPRLRARAGRARVHAWRPRSITRTRSPARSPMTDRATSLA